MAYMYNFCFYFSLRLGTIIVGILSLLQGIPTMVALIIGTVNSDSVSMYIEDLMDENNLAFMTSTFEWIAEDPKKYMITLLIYICFYLIFCVALIYGAYSLTTFMMYPYIFSELIRLITLFGAHVATMMVIKENVINLGLLIGFSVLGGFIMLGLFYMWICTLSLVQVVKELMREIEITDITNFPQKPAEVRIRNKSYFNY